MADEEGAPQAAKYQLPAVANLDGMLDHYNEMVEPLDLSQAPHILNRFVYR